MFRLTLAQMRRSIGRLVAAGLAIAIGTAFVAATLLAGDVMNRTARDAVTARYGQADVVVAGTLSDADLATIRSAPGVAAADVLTGGGVELRTARQDRWQLVAPTVHDERLTALRVQDGRMPTRAGEIALPRKVAEAFGVTLGDTLTAVWQAAPAAPAAGAEPTAAPTAGEKAPAAAVPTAKGAATPELTETMTLVGFVDDPHGAWTSGGGAALALPEDVGRWRSGGSLLAEGTNEIVVAAAAGTTPVALRAELATALPATHVLTRADAAAEQMKRLGKGGDQVLVTVVLGFAAVAMLVAALVIANTFQVLVAQRTRTLALLRAVGARRAQLRASVLVEATLLGVASSGAGILAGTGLAQATLSVLHHTSVTAPLPAAVHLTWQVVVVPLLVGTLVTVLASLVPARAATHVTAIEALRPIDAPRASAGAGRARLAVAGVLVGLGVVTLGGAVALGLASKGSPLASLGLGVLGGTVSFVGLLLSAVFWVPPVLGALERGLGRLGPVPRLAAANTVRNPRRTAATSTALLIGVTLVVMMSTGAASARASLDRTLDGHFPVDIEITPTAYDASGRPAGLPAGLATRVAAVDGVHHVAALRSETLAVTDDKGQPTAVTVRALSPEDAAQVLRDGTASAALAGGAMLVPSWLHVPTGRVQLRPVDASGTPVGAGIELDRAMGTGLAEAVVTPAVMDRLAPAAPADTLFVSLDAGADPIVALRSVQDALGTAALQATGPATSRAQYDRVIGIMLAVVIGLLGVAVLIALLGVTNTLSLSVIERRRESATLRAIGLTHGGLRGALAIEGVLIAGVGAVLGIALGLAYGWAGAATVLGQVGGFVPAVPWRDLGLVLAVALGAGLLASVVPARSAVRTPPVAALAEE
jgi:putative ABC transport system permease protein